MSFVTDPFNVLVEAANNDIMTDTKMAIRESEIVSRYTDIEELAEPIMITAEMVTVVNVNGEFFTEMQFLAPYMKCNKIKSVAEAITNVCEANNLPNGSIGLLVESQECVTDVIEKALDKGPKAKKKALEKVGKVENLIDKIKSKGIKVKKKSKKCPKCGKEECVCENDALPKTGKEDSMDNFSDVEECDKNTKK